jgi:hypothetical protein
MDNLAYVLAGYLITGAALGGYVVSLTLRARRARERAEAFAVARSGRTGRAPDGSRSAGDRPGPEGSRTSPSGPTAQESGSS